MITHMPVSLPVPYGKRKRLSSNICPELKIPTTHHMCFDHHDVVVVFFPCWKQTNTSDMLLTTDMSHLWFRLMQLKY